MAFNNIGNHRLAPGESTSIAIAYVIDGEPRWGGHDLGAQWIMADPINIGGLVVRDHRKDYVWLGLGNPDSGERPRLVTYSVTVENVGPDLVNFSLQGGGNV